jgi:hypothetical protein
MEKTIDTLFGNDLFSKIYFVDSNPAKVETIEVAKVNSEIKEIKVVEEFNLLKTYISKSGLLSLNIRETVKSNLLSRLNFDSNTVEFKYFNRGFIRNLFYKKRNPKELVNLFDDKDWIITSDEIISELATLDEFEHTSGYGDIRLVGRIGSTLVFKIKDMKNSIYVGNKDSITVVFKKSMSEDVNGIYIEYLFQVNSCLHKIIIQ